MCASLVWPVCLPFYGWLCFLRLIVMLAANVDLCSLLWLAWPLWLACSTFMVRLLQYLRLDLTITGCYITCGSLTYVICGSLAGSFAFTACLFDSGLSLPLWLVCICNSFAFIARLYLRLVLAFWASSSFACIAAFVLHSGIAFLTNFQLCSHSSTVSLLYIACVAALHLSAFACIAVYNRIAA